MQANAQNATEHASYVDHPPGFAKAVGRASRNDQHSHSPDEVLPSNFGRKLNLDDGSQGQFLHTSLYLLITNPALLDILLLHNFSKFIELLVGFSLCCAFLHRFPGCEMQLHILFMRIKVQSSKWVPIRLSPAGARMHASQSAQRLESSGDTSASGRPSVDSESSSLAPGRQQQPVHPVMNAR